MTVHDASICRRRSPLVASLIALVLAAGALAGLSGDPAMTAVGNPDRQPPKVKIASPVAGATLGGTVTVSGSASDNVSVSKVELRVDSNAYLLATGTASWTILLNTSAYASGSHTLTARATDSSGNQATTSRTVTFGAAADTQIPTVTITSPAEGATVTGAITVSGTGSDNVSLSTVELRVDGDAYQPASGTTAWTFTLDTSAYASGSHTLTARATDSSGNQATTSRTVTFGAAADTQIPTVTITSPAEGATVTGAITVSGTGSDNVSLSTVELRVDGDAYQLASGTTAWTFTLDTSAYASGSHTLTARATDSSGNQATTSRTVTFGAAADTQIPTVTITSPAEGATVTGAITVSGTGSDNVSLSTVELRVDGNAYQPASGTTSWTITLDTSAYASGSHTLTARATDSSGNQATTSRTVTFGAAADTQIPTVTITSPAEGATVTGAITVSGTGSDNVSLSTVELRVDGNAYQPASGTTAWTFTLDTSAYASGSHTLTARATDSSGNQATTSRTVTFGAAADTQIPTVTITSPAEGATVTGAITVSGTGSDNVSLSTVELRVDGDAYQPASGTTSWTITLDTSAYASGSHTLTARATDSSGNQATTSRTVTFGAAADTQIPTVTITSPAEGATVTGAITVSGTGSDNVSLSTVELRVDGNAYQLASGTTSWTITLDTSAYASGSHTLTARAIDSSGNRTWAGRTVTFSGNDSRVPTVTIQSPAAGAALGGIVTVSGSASDNVSVSKVELRVDGNAYQLANGTTFWTFSLNTSAYASGSHTLTARATDSSGNQATISRTVTFGSAADTQIPTVTITSPVQGATVTHAITVAGTGSDNGSLSKVELRVDGNPYQLVSGMTSWIYTLDTSAYASGSHTLTARAIDSSGNQAWASRTMTFTSVPNAKVYWGAFMEAEDTYSYHYGGTWGNGPWDASTVSRFESHAGKKVSIMHWGAAPPWEHDFNNWRSGFDLVQNAGALSLVGMMTGTVPLRDIANGLYDASIRTWFQQAAAYGRPFFLLLNPEMNGTWQWYSPGINGNTAADFVAAWRHFHDLAQQEGATNITWVWCPNVDPTNMYTPYSALYPGDAYVDWTGFNGFNRDGKSSFSWLFGSSYNTLLQIAPTKPILISETSSEETLGNKVGWITDTFSSQLPLYFPRIKAVVWLNWRMWQSPRWWNWEIESTPSAQQAFATAISSPYYLAGGGLGGLPLRTKITPP